MQRKTPDSRDCRRFRLMEVTVSGKASPLAGIVSQAYFWVRTVKYPLTPPTLT